MEKPFKPECSTAFTPMAAGEGFGAGPPDGCGRRFRGSNWARSAARGAVASVVLVPGSQQPQEGDGNRANFTGLVLGCIEAIFFRAHAIEDKFRKDQSCSAEE